MYKPLLLVSALIPLALTAACSSRQPYGAGQASQRNECYQINDREERKRCLESPSSSYEEYQREAEAAKRSK